MATTMCMVVAALQATRLEAERARLSIQSQELQIWDMARDEEIGLLKVRRCYTRGAGMHVWCAEGTKPLAIGTGRTYTYMDGGSDLTAWAAPPPASRARMRECSCIPFGVGAARSDVPRVAHACMHAC